MELKYLVLASAVAFVTVAVTADPAVSQIKAQKLLQISPYSVPLPGKSGRSILEAQAAEAVVNMAINSQNRSVNDPQVNQGSQGIPGTMQTQQPAVNPAPAPAAAAPTKLRPDQKYCVELSIANVDPAQRPFIYEDIAKSVAKLDERQIAAMVKGMEGNSSKEDIAKAKKLAAQDGPITGALSAGDFEYNRAQYEPAIRKAWDAQHKFDEFINAKLAAYCPGRDTYARFGSAWRYELPAFMMPSHTATDRPDIDVQVMGTAYAPQDGRYNFDFSKVRYTFDEKAVDAAVKEGCEAYHAAGKAFLAKVDPMIAAKNWDGAFKLERTSSGVVEPIREKLTAKLEPLSPNYGYPMMQALQNAKKVKA